MYLNSMALEQWSVSSLRLFDLIIISNLIVCGIVIYQLRTSLGDLISKLFVPTIIIGAISVIGWLDRDSLIGLVVDPPSLCIT